MLSPSSVEATVTGPYGQSAGICGANTSAVQSRPGMRTIGVMRGSGAGSGREDYRSSPSTFARIRSPGTGIPSPRGLATACEPATACRPAGAGPARRPARPPQAMVRHISAQRRHASAQAWQCACSCRSHSPAQTSQSKAHSEQICCTWALRRDTAAEAKRHALAQSRSCRMQSARRDTWVSRRHSATQWSHAAAQASQAEMQASYCWFAMGTP